MAGTFQLILRIVAAVATTTYDIATGSLPGSIGSHGTASYFIDVTGITGTWDITVQWDAPNSTNLLSIATLASMTTTGVKRIPLTADFNTAKSAVFPHSLLLITMQVAGQLDGIVYVSYGD